MAETLDTLLHEAQNEMTRKAGERDRVTTSIDDLHNLADEIAKQYAQDACTFTADALNLLLNSGTAGLGMLTGEPDEVYDGDSPLTLIQRNIEEFLYNDLYDLADLIMGEWEEEAEQARCRTPGCDGDPNDGEGWDGFCGNCADKQG